jgi:hypothetical protein
MYIAYMGGQVMVRLRISVSTARHITTLARMRLTTERARPYKPPSTYAPISVMFYKDSIGWAVCIVTRSGVCCNVFEFGNHILIV